jgi:hypothetical protein
VGRLLGGRTIRPEEELDVIALGRDLYGRRPGLDATHKRVVEAFDVVVMDAAEQLPRSSRPS